ncbi:hypothetical protein N9W06_01120 [Candidatus Marinimicrobia bacterium]|nr:hypothetical protein [Candidatus Neomarinimicrobiota bacterium]|tara:strand:+ start:2721 stop:2879 length:159 start_codon:yes stop_codon:yes gene_type:complete
MSKEKRRLVVDNGESYWIVDGRRLSKKEAIDLQLKLDKKYFKISKKDEVSDS